MITKGLAWRDEIACEGGPVLVANLVDFEQWSGCEPFDASRATALHYWSPFTSELPGQWQPNGPTGHQYLSSANPPESREALMSVLLGRWPGTVVDRTSGTWHATRPDGRVLRAALSPDSEYECATRHLKFEGVHHFGIGATAYLLSVVPGQVRIDVDEKRNFLLLSQVESADDDVDVQKAYAHALRAKSCQEQGVQFRVTDGPVVVAWSPNSARDLKEPIGNDDAGQTVSGMLLDMTTDGSGALIWLEPGLYQSTLQGHEEDTWDVSWCRLQRISD